jgi:hypothetical protein
METWSEGSDLVILLEDRIEVMRLNSATAGTPAVTSYTLDTVVLEGVTSNTVLNMIYDFNIQDIILVKVDGGHTMKFLPGDSCHVNCATCTQSFAPNNSACTSCSGGTTMDPTGNYCKKDANPNPPGGFYDTYVGITGPSFDIDKEVVVTSVDESIDPNKIVENNTSVVFIMIGTILLLTLIILFGLVSFTNF